MKYLRIPTVALAALTVTILGTSLPQASMADTYYRTYTYTRTSETPAMITAPVTVQRVIEQPAVIERFVEQPAVVERVIEKPVVVEKTVERPVVITPSVAPVVIEQQRDDQLLHLDLLHLLHLGLF